jgi:hypothetical protein
MVASGCVEAGSGFQARVTLGLRGCYETRCRRSAARILCPTPTRGLTAPATFIPPLRGWIDRLSICLFHLAGLERNFVTVFTPWVPHPSRRFLAKGWARNRRS